jgi:predicted nucleic acid-binding protein
MANEKLRLGKDRIEGVVDVGIIVISHFENPAKDVALEFLANVLKWKRKCIIPTSTILGAYHILTRYLKVERASAYDALTRTLKTQSPAFYDDISVEIVLDSLTNALGYNVESWDGYIVALAKKFKATIYTVDMKLIRKVRDVPVVNPIPDDVFKEYNRWLKSQLERQ